jgi:hypothetical protein
MPNYTQVENAVLQDSRISFKAKGIYSLICYLRQYHGIEYPTIQQIKNHGKDGSAAVISGINELKNIGILPPRPPHKSLRKPGFIYFIQSVRHYEFCGELTKIGASSNPAYRTRQLEKEFGRLTIREQAPVQDMGKSEADLHSLFYRERVQGEWFSLTPLDIRNAVKFLEEKGQ